jgi:uncharacterized protein
MLAACPPAAVRWLELLMIFAGLPVLAFLLRDSMQHWLVPLLLALALYCYVLMVRDTRFKRFRLLNAEQVPRLLKRRLPIFIIGALLCALVYALAGGNRWFQLPVEATSTWLVLLVVYPLLSAWPQELIFRTFLFHRYKTIIPRKKHRMWLSTLAFAFAHIIYANPAAIVLALIGGLLFSYTYAKTRSTLACVVEHSLWGIWLFSLGLGQYLDSGALG